MNRMIEFAKNTRTTDYFRDYAIVEIKIAYRVMEYLAPDSIFKPTITQSTKDLMLQKRFSAAFEAMCESDNLGFENIGSSIGAESLRTNAIELMAYLLPIYEASEKDAKEQRRLELLKELRELDERGGK